MSDDLEKSFQVLKQTVPLLLKHRISAEPENYALWYTYVSNQSPELTKEVDTALERFKSLSKARTQQLIRDYVSDKEEVEAWQLRQSIEAMLIELNQSMKDTRVENKHFQKAMDKSLDGLQKIEDESFSVKDVMKVVRTMVKEGEQIRRNAKEYDATIASAEKEIKILREKLAVSEKQAMVDALTNLYNRRFFDSELDSATENKDVALILADVDHFKQFNDTHGHQMGDQVLRAVAKKLKNACREGQEAFRYGGEEFAIICRGVNQKRASHIAENMRMAIEKIQLKHKSSGKTVSGISASFGVSVYQEDCLTSAKLIEVADNNLYEAKRLGRNRVMPMPG
ncbi:MAG: GGDEF domain-containing protein [Aestuariibacter sp.]